MDDLNVVAWNNRRSLDYKTIKEIARKTKGLNADDLFVLDDSNDPFYCGAPRQVLEAEWFREVWELLGHDDNSRVHLRRLHYQIVSREEGEKVRLHRVLTWDGGKESTDIYVNVYACWDLLMKASKSARYLGLIPVSSIIDRRNPEARLFDENGKPRARFTVEMDEEVSQRFELHSGMLAWIDEIPEFPRYTTDQTFGDRIYHCEIWAEKSTMNDVLIPLCRFHEINLVTGLGELSIKACWDLVNRSTWNARPTRIFYLSDFDPKGRDMPVSVGVKIQWMIDQIEGWQDIKLIPLLLTHEQVDKYELPGEPIKKTEKGRARFVESFGDRATELDALEALHPGEMESLIESAIEQYTSASLENWRDERWEEYEDRLYEVIDLAISDLNERRNALRKRRKDISNEMGAELSGMRSRRNAILRKYEDEVKEMSEEWESIYEESRSRMMAALFNDDNSATIDDAIQNVEVFEFGDDFLFNSNRTYIEQLAVFKVHQKKPMKLNLIYGGER